MSLRALALNCTLKSGDSPSSTQRLLDDCLADFARHGVSGETIRVADHDVKPGVTSDEGPGDAWPTIRARVLASDILVIGTPIWLGQPSSIAKRVLERMDAFLSEMDDRERMVSYGRVGVVAVVGNEDGAHHVAAEIYQALSDVGFTIPASGVTYWVGEAMGGVDYRDLDETPQNVAGATDMMVRNAVHLAGLLKANPYPGRGEETS